MISQDQPLPTFNERRTFSTTRSFLMHRAATIVGILEDLHPSTPNTDYILRISAEYEDLRGMLSMISPMIPNDYQSLWALHCALYQLPIDHSASTLLNRGRGARV